MGIKRRGKSWFEVEKWLSARAKFIFGAAMQEFACSLYIRWQNMEKVWAEIKARLCFSKGNRKMLSRIILGTDFMYYKRHSRITSVFI